LYTPEGEPLLFPDEEAALRVQAERAMDEERSARLRAEQERDRAEQDRGDAVARTVYLEALLAKHGIAPE
jgi:hypothetical protein